MRALVVDRVMEPCDLKVRDVPEPPLAPGMLKLAVRAAGCNFSSASATSMLGSVVCSPTGSAATMWVRLPLTSEPAAISTRA